MLHRLLFRPFLLLAVMTILSACETQGGVVLDYCDSAELRAELAEFTRPDGALAQKLSLDDRARLERIRDWVAKGCQLRQEVDRILAMDDQLRALEVAPGVIVEADALTDPTSCEAMRTAAVQEAAATGEPVFYRCAGRALVIVMAPKEAWGSG